MPDVVQSKVECPPNNDKIPFPEIETENNPNLVKSALIIAPKAIDNYLDLESKCSTENLKDILLPEVGDEDDANVVTQSLLEKFTENNSLIVV